MCEDTFNWTAFAAIWQAIGTVATFAAVFVALWQTKYANKKKLKISFTDNTTAFTQSNVIAYFVSLTISNIGNRPITIHNWGIVEANNKRGVVLQDVNDPILSGMEPRLPHKLDVEESATVAVRAENFYGYLKEHVQSGKLDGNKKLSLFVADSVGHEYRVKSKTSVNDIIANLESLLRSRKQSDLF